MDGRSQGEWVSVDLLDEAPPPKPTAGRPSRRGLGIVGFAAALVLAAMVLWPQPGGGPEAEQPPAGQSAGQPQTPAPDDPRLLDWPGRGPWAGDEEFVEAAATAWRTMAPDGEPGPGVDVHALWAGPVGEVDVAVLQSVGDDGLARVAQVTESRIPGSANPGALMLTNTEVIGVAPPFVTLSYGGGLDLAGVLRDPGSSLLQVLPAPDLLSDGVELQRQDGSNFAQVGMQDDGLSQPWVHTPWLAPEGPVLASVRTQGAQPGVLTISLIDPQRLLPGPAPIQLVPAGWGRLRMDLPQDYLDAQYALEAVGRTSGRVSILGSTALPDGHAALVEVRPAGPGRPVVVTVGSRGPGGPLVSEPRPATTPDEVALGAVRSPAGDVLVVAAAPPDASLIVVGADGLSVGTGPRTTALWVPRGVQEVAAQAYRDDETWVGRTSLDVGDL